MGGLIFVLTGFMFGFAAFVRYWRVSVFSAAGVLSLLLLQLDPSAYFDQ